VIRQKTFVATHGHGRDAPNPAIRILTIDRLSIIELPLPNGAMGVASAPWPRRTPMATWRRFRLVSSEPIQPAIAPAAQRYRMREPGSIPR
jgi:hypothetical protein